MSNKQINNDDYLLGAFLDLLEQDVEQDARQLRPVDTKLAWEIQPLVDNIEINMEAALPDEDEWPETGKNDR